MSPDSRAIDGSKLNCKAEAAAEMLAESKLEKREEIKFFIQAFFEKINRLQQVFGRVKFGSVFSSFHVRNVLRPLRQPQGKMG